MDFIENDDGPMHNPFADRESKYEAFLYKQNMQLVSWLAALTKSVEEMDKRLTGHERAHNVANAQAMRMSDPVAKDEKLS